MPRSSLTEQTLAAEQKECELGASTAFPIIQYLRDRVTGQTLKAQSIDIVEAMAGKVSRPPGAILA